MFLHAIKPHGPWDLIRFPSAQSERLDPDNSTALGSLLNAAHEAAQGVYYHLNTLRGIVGSKAKKIDVAFVDSLHIDIDPRTGEPLDQERDRILCLLTTNLPDGIPKPTFIIDSGGGYQAIWRLREPISLAPDEATDAEKIAAAEEVERLTRGLELAFGADSCHNVDRVLRLVGSVNHPNKKKAEVGREPALAKLVLHEPDHVYVPDEFPKAPPKTTVASVTREAVGLEGLPRLESIDQLPDAVSDRIRGLIVRGHDSEDPDKYPSRSEALFAVCCALAKAGVSDDIILGIITDQDFGISASILDKNQNAERYARRQIKQAHDAISDDPVVQINRNYCAVLEGSKLTFYREEDNGTVTPMNKEAFLFELGHLRKMIPSGNSSFRCIS